MTDLLGIGASALLAYRTALDTAGHNIANANTPGYTRQRVELSSRLGGPNGAGYVGSGVQIDTVRRITDALTGARRQGDASGFGRAQVFEGLAVRLDGWLSGADSSLSKPLQAFFGSLTALSANPASTASRQTLIADAQSLASRFVSEQSRLDAMDAEIDQALKQNVAEINGFSSEVARLNERIAQAQGAAGGQPPNDLLDQREQLVLQISARIGISTTQQADGTLSVFTGSGQALVNGRQANALTTMADDFGQRLEIGFGAARLNNLVSGGAIGGLLDARRELVDPARTELGRMAAALGTAVNGQHRSGMTQAGQLGGDFFAPLNVAAAGARANTGSASVSIGFTDPGALEATDFELRYDGATWRLFDAAGAQRTLSGDGSAGNPLRAAGLALTVSGTAAAGDRFQVQPMRSAAGQMRVAVAQPGDIAAASPLRSSATLSNTGTGTIGAVVSRDAANPAHLAPVTIQFTSATTYSIDGAGSYTYASGADIDVNGWRVQVGGQPASGDTFSVGPTAASSSDGGNARALSRIASGGLLDGGRVTVGDVQSARVAKAGTSAQQAGLQLDAQAAIKAQSDADHEAVSGVNLDEEAADLVRYQQAYQAAARIIQVADECFRALLEAGR